MAMNVAGIRRNLKNLAHNYSDAQIKVREATSNDPWGPSSTIMSEIADLTYNVVAFSEIMQMIWKRLNDHGRNWRHVYKALVLLEYLIKTGTEKVAQQCKENIFAIQTLKDFQHQEESKDQGIHVREKAKQLVTLLKDDERLKNERARALKAKERFAQSASGFGSDSGDAMSPTSPGFASALPYQSDWTPTCEATEAATRVELESARPQTAGEEELQLQLALAMSREEAEQEEQRRRSDDVRLQLALSQSQEEFKGKSDDPLGAPQSGGHLLDLLEVAPDPLLGATGLDTSSTDPWGMPVQPPPQRPQGDPWNSPVSLPSASSVASPARDPWIAPAVTPVPVTLAPSPKPVTNDPWRASPVTVPPVPAPRSTTAADPWSPLTEPSSAGLSAAASPINGDVDEFDIISNRERPQLNNVNGLNNNGTTNGRAISPDPFDFSELDNSLLENMENKGGLKKTPESFLGENSALVNLDNLVSGAKPPVVAAPTVANPFAGANLVEQPNPFHQQQQQQQVVKPSINQMRMQQQFGPWGPAESPPLVAPSTSPLLSTQDPHANPFLS